MGGRGADSFVFRPGDGHDRIRGFDPERDKIVFGDLIVTEADLPEVFRILTGSADGAEPLVYDGPRGVTIHYGHALKDFLDAKSSPENQNSLLEYGDPSGDKVILLGLTAADLTLDMFAA